MTAIQGKNVRVDDGTYAKIHQLAKEEERTLAMIVKRSVLEYWNRYDVYNQRPNKWDHAYKCTQPNKHLSEDISWQDTRKLMKDYKKSIMIMRTTKKASDFIRQEQRKKRLLLLVLILSNSEN